MTWIWGSTVVMRLFVLRRAGLVARARKRSRPKASISLSTAATLTPWIALSPRSELDSLSIFSGVCRRDHCRLVALRCSRRARSPTS